MPFNVANESILSENIGVNKEVEAIDKSIAEDRNALEAQPKRRLKSLLDKKNS